MSAPSQLSFLPDDYLLRKAQRRANILCGVLAVIVLGVIVSAFQYMEKNTKVAEKRFADVDQNYAEAARRIEKVNQMRAQQQQVVRRAELAASLVEKVPRSNILAELTKSLPPGLSLTNLTMESRERVSAAPAPRTAFEQQRAALEGRTAAPVLAPKVYEVFLKIDGVASTDLQVGDLMEKLKHSPLFKDVNLIFTEEYKPATASFTNNSSAVSNSTNNEVLRKFQMEMMLNPNAEVTNPVNPNTKTSVEVSGGNAPQTQPAGNTAAAGADTKELGTK